ncbi:hypothetical protein L1987_50000 [Smallanthus sonchifolius]|uniref:Uncharacterized protein n=1 Tax=Smallanthus sonchifolius TaxID=185202 RepID=A0ACB9FW15_9ASTR|nr:hypothetical protein L1987_50000 [Smallanthus sonchifolius]
MPLTRGPLTPVPVSSPANVQSPAMSYAHFFVYGDIFQAHKFQILLEPFLWKKNKSPDLPESVGGFFQLHFGKECLIDPVAAGKSGGDPESLSMIILITYSISGRAYLKFMGNDFRHPKRVEFPMASNGFSFSLAKRDCDLLAREGVHQNLLSFDKCDRSEDSTVLVSLACGSLSGIASSKC